MVNSRDKNALERLDIGPKEYHSIVKNAYRMQALTSNQKNRILERAGEKFPEEILYLITKATGEFCSDREFNQIAGISYWRNNFYLIKTAVVDYFLRERNNC
jgi:hypothetical protein